MEDKVRILEEIDAEIARLEEARRVFVKLLAARIASEVNVAAVFFTACQKYDCTREDIQGRSRKANYVLARAEIAKTLRNKPFGFPLAKIGKCLGGRDHSTIINLLKKANETTTGGRTSEAGHT